MPFYLFNEPPGYNEVLDFNSNLSLNIMVLIFIIN